jgi:hypothetical protein
MEDDNVSSEGGGGSSMAEVNDHNRNNCDSDSDKKDLLR